MDESQTITIISLTINLQIQGINAKITNKRLRGQIIWILD